MRSQHDLFGLWQVTDVLTGNRDETSVVKHYLQPFKARMARLYPWDGNNNVIIALRMELYTVVKPFQWGALVLSDSHGTVGSNSFCNKTLTDLTPAFDSWTAGLSGDEITYVSRAFQAAFRGIEYTLTAYQRRRCVFLGILTKRLVCFNSRTGVERCCVHKEAKSLDRGQWDQQEVETKLA